MSLFDIDRFTILEPRGDWFSIVGDIPEIDYEDADSCHHIQNQFYDWGFMKIPKRDRLTFRSDLFGIEISFAKKRGTGNRYVKIEIQGKGCADSVENIEKKVREIKKKFGTF